MTGAVSDPPTPASAAPTTLASTRYSVTYRSGRLTITGVLDVPARPAPARGTPAPGLGGRAVQLYEYDGAQHRFDPEPWRLSMRRTVAFLDATLHP